MYKVAAVAASLHGLMINSGAAGLRVDHGSLTQASSRGWRCWIAHSKDSLFDLRLAALMMPSISLMRSVTTVSFQWFLFLELSLMMTTSLTFGCDICFPLACWCCPCKLLTYSDLHHFHIASLHLSKNFAPYLKSLSGN